MSIFQLAKPRKTLEKINAALPLVGGLTSVFLIWGLLEALWISPPDYQQGEFVRIMYVHVPASWIALFAYGVMAFNAGIFLVWRLPLANIISEAACPLGMIFTLTSLITGSLWGKPTWGTWWVWDARLTSMLLLFFLYVGVFSLRDSFSQEERGKRMASFLAVIGLINLPIIKGSVVWWQTLHQPASVMRWAKPAMAPQMLVPLGLMSFAFLGYFLFLLMMRVRQQLGRSLAL